MRPGARADRRRLLATLPALAGMALGAPALAQTAPTPPAAPAEVSGALREARLVGTARMRFLTLHIYDARLWASQPPQADYAAAPLALELLYARTLQGVKIAERSLQEMRRVGSFDEPTAQRWLAEMNRLFPDVAAGDRLTGVHLPGDGARFFLNGALRGEVRDAEFSRLFFGIWLSPKTSEPALRAQLLGGTKAGP